MTAHQDPSAATTAVEEPATAGKERLAVVDCDVHPHFRSGLETLEQYLTPAWRRRLLGSAHGQAWATQVYASHFSLPKNDLYINPVGAMRRDAYTEDGSVPGSDPAHVARQLLDAYDVERAVLICGNTLGLGALPDADAAAAVASATNEWLTEQWLQEDKRFRGALVVAPQDPEQAAAEIERVGDRPGVVQVFLPLVNILMGERHYHPIYEAAERKGLPVSVHPNSVDAIHQKAPTLAGGVPTYYVEWHSLLSQVFHANVVSLVCHGIFERFPKLKVIVTEGGFAWLVDAIWRLEKDWQALRDEVPWVKRRPSEYVFDHVRLTTQPFPEPLDSRHVQWVCDAVQAERTLLFSSDYPHWDFDSPARALGPLPAATRRRILRENALELYGDRLA